MSSILAHATTIPFLPRSSWTRKERKRVVKKRSNTYGVKRRQCKKKGIVRKRKQRKQRRRKKTI